MLTTFRLFRKVLHFPHTSPNSAALMSICSHTCDFLSAPQCFPCTDAHCCALLRQDGSICTRSGHFPRTGQTRTERFLSSRPFVWLLTELSRAGTMASFWFCGTALRKHWFGRKSEGRPRGRARASLSILENKDPPARCCMPFLEAGVDPETRSLEAS